MIYEAGQRNQVIGLSGVMGPIMGGSLVMGRSKPRKG